MHGNSSVCFLTNERDVRVAVLAMMGFSMKHIAKKTRYNFGQISYRLKLAGIRLDDYRQGRNTAAKSATKMVQMSPTHQLAALLSRELKVQISVTKNGNLRLADKAKK